MTGGKTIREDFAKAAMQGLLAHLGMGHADKVGCEAVLAADALIVALNEPVEPKPAPLLIPDGWKPVEYREPRVHEFFLSDTGLIGYHDGRVTFVGRRAEHIILVKRDAPPEPKPPSEAMQKLRAFLMEVRADDEWLVSGVTQTRLRIGDLREIAGERP